MFTKIKKKIRNTFLAGLLVLIPTAITIYVFYLIFSKLNNILTVPRLTKVVNLFGYQLPPYLNIPFLSLITTIILIFVVGLLTTSYGGRKIIQSLEKVLDKVPLFRTIYQASKSALEVLANPEKNAFRQVVLVEFPRKGAYTVGFVTGETPTAKDQLPRTEERMVNVFVPTAPTPTQGFMLILHREELVPLDVSVEEGFRLVISAGAISPKDFKVVFPGVGRGKDDAPVAGKIE